jgi:uroporphyrinogen-III decarboxylase
MFKETMTSKERILAAINLEPYDRVPVAPQLNLEYVFRRKGRPTADAYNFANAGQGLQFAYDLVDEVGGLDAMALCLGGGVPFTPPLVTLFAALYGDTMKFPGADERLSNEESTPQFAERQILTADDYDTIIGMGWHNFCLANLDRISKSVFGIPLNIMPLPNIAKLMTDSYIATRDAWHQRGIPVLSGVILADPQMLLSLMRGLVDFTLDLHRQPDKVKEVLKIMSRDITEETIKAMLLTGHPPAERIPGIILQCERGSATYYNLKIYEEFIWPFIKEQILAYHEAGFVTTLHFDTDWTRNLPYLLEVPAKSCIVELDSTSDIFKAKETLGDHLCIMGDVPASLSSHGTPQDMREYCEKLIDIVGKDTGLILSTGCAVPPNTKRENFQMMIDTARNHPPPRSR